MSGPVRAEDVRPDDPDGTGGPDGPARPDEAESDTVEITESRTSEVGGHRVRRALPRRDRRTVGAWCFADHMGPAALEPTDPFGVGPHPHMGLQTVTWLLRGELLHRDSLGSEQPIRPGQLNLMTAGGGVSHAEEGTGGRELHGIQLWIAQPERTRHGDAAFEHHAELPAIDLGAATATVLVGSFAGLVSPARRDSDLVGLELVVRRGTTTLPTDPRFEHAIVVLDGSVQVGGHVVEPGRLAYLGLDRTELSMRSDAEARVILVGGVPFEARPLMWWNFVGRDRDEIAGAVADWNRGTGRFGETSSVLASIPSPAPPWT